MTMSAATAAATRWRPTPDQLMILEELYMGGIKTPSAGQIQRITNHLSLYGKIECKNVFYWFQNHKAREKQKIRKRLLLGKQQYHYSLQHQQPLPPPPPPPPLQLLPAGHHHHLHPPHSILGPQCYHHNNVLYLVDPAAQYNCNGLQLHSQGRSAVRCARPQMLDRFCAGNKDEVLMTAGLAAPAAVPPLDHLTDDSTSATNTTTNGSPETLELFPTTTSITKLRPPEPQDHPVKAAPALALDLVTTMDRSGILSL